MAKLVLGIVAGLAVALLAGFVWGRSGQSAVARTLDGAEVRADLLGARAATLDARVAIYNVNFGEASRHLEDARALVRSAAERVKRSGDAAGAGKIEAVLPSVDEAQRLSGKLDQGANSRAGDAAKALADVLAERPAH